MFCFFCHVTESQQEVVQGWYGSSSVLGLGLLLKVSGIILNRWLLSPVLADTFVWGLSGLPSPQVWQAEVQGSCNPQERPKSLTLGVGEFIPQLPLPWRKGGEDN